MSKDRFDTHRTRKLVQELIDIGRIGEPASTTTKPPRRGYRSILPYNKPLAARLATELSRDDLQALIKGLVLFSVKTGQRLSGGSASPVPPLFREYSSRYPDDACDLCDWIFDNRVNSYDPFGHQTPIRSRD